MEPRDLYIAPFYLAFILAAAWLLRKRFVSPDLMPFFFPGLLVRLGGAMTLGLIYRFLYPGYDTFEFFEEGKVVSEALRSDLPGAWRLLLTVAGVHHPGTEAITSQLISRHFMDPASFLFIKVTGLLNFLTFDTYSAAALLFAVTAFSGAWAMFAVAATLYPALKREMAVAFLFVPSVVLWNSGLLKDTLGFAACGWLLYGFHSVFFRKKKVPASVVLIVLSAWLMGSLRPYLFLVFVPSLLVWLAVSRLQYISSMLLRLTVIPALLASFAAAYLLLPYYTGGEFAKYWPENIELTIMKHHLFNAREGQSSGYALEGFDYRVLSDYILKSPTAVVTSLFRPYPWEAKGALMWFAAAENFLFMMLSLIALYRLIRNGRVNIRGHRYFPLFCVLFVLLLACATGFSSYNFGALNRYRSPMMPFFAAVLAVMIKQRKEIPDTKFQ